MLQVEIGLLALLLCEELADAEFEVGAVEVAGDLWEAGPLVVFGSWLLAGLWAETNAISPWLHDQSLLVLFQLPLETEIGTHYRPLGSNKHDGLSECPAFPPHEVGYQQCG
jgi:hypothetical protein